MNQIDKVIEGLKILKSYGTIDLGAAHDEILTGGGLHPEKFNKEDLVKLAEYGFHWDGYKECWCRFV